ncbi:TIGR02391 family protein [Leucobacter sp. 7(1)]|uniref:TIGR02391 family protein n=1 Tax=Leucobacter sp. 7(1) TaxID=1255613 RepID=UPI000B354C03|nr:TIGR02391 family protein [Leucobacter sp. 7(1)]
MSGIDKDWAINQLTEFIRLSSTPNGELKGIWTSDKTRDEVLECLPIVERILDKVISGWRADLERPGSAYEEAWTVHRKASLGARSLLLHQSEIDELLGEAAPDISAANLHPWIWIGAKSLWQSAHYREAVEGSIKKLNAEAQNKVGRRDLSETKLFQESFSPADAKTNKARLRRMRPEDSDTYRSVQRGAMAFAEGVFAGIRNPLSHEADQELSEQVALEYLAALSVLARWVDESTVEHSGVQP